MLRDEIADENDVLSGNNSAPIAPRLWHLLPSMANRKLERKSAVADFLRGLYRLTWRQTGAASVSGFPAASNNCA